MGNRSKAVVAVLVISSAALIPLTLSQCLQHWSTATSEEIARAVDPILRSPPTFTREDEIRSQRLSRLVGSFHWREVMGNGPKMSQQASLSENLQIKNEIRSIVSKGPTRCKYAWAIIDRFVDPRDDDTPRGYPPFFFESIYDNFGKQPSDLFLVERCAQAQLQGVDRLFDISALMADQQEADRIVAEAVDSGRLSADQAQDLAKEFFVSDEIDTAIKRACAGEFWSFDAKNILTPEISKAYSFGVPKARDRVGNYDALATAKDISAEYMDLVSSSKQPPAESCAPTEARIEIRRKGLPPTRDEMTPNLDLSQIRTRIALGSRNDLNSFGVRHVEAKVSNLIDQELRADTVAAHRLLQVKLADFAFRKERKASPASLEELVQTGYLPEIPLDPWSHGRMLFDTKTKTVCSTGHDRSLGKNSLLTSNPTTRRIGLSFKLP